jgi:hypothetical protein
LLSEALSFEVDAVGVMDEAIEDCVGDGRTSDRGKLAGDDDRTSFISVLDAVKSQNILVGCGGMRLPQMLYGASGCIFCCFSSPSHC